MITHIQVKLFYFVSFRLLSFEYIIVSEQHHAIIMITHIQVFPVTQARGFLWQKRTPPVITHVYWQRP